MTDSAARSALDHAWYLVRRGEVADARFWAREAANLDAGLEEAWLILAALSDPNESFEYLKRALEINPRSRRGKLGVTWAETKTGRFFRDFLSGLAKFTDLFTEPVPQEPITTFDLSAFADSLDPYQDVDPIPEIMIEDPLFVPQIEPDPPIRTIIRQRRKPRQIPSEPVDPWSVLLPYTFSFIIFFFSASLWLLSGMPNVMAQSLEPTQSIEQRVNQILTENPVETITPNPSATPIPTNTPTIFPTITPTFTPQPTSTIIPPTPQEDSKPNTQPIQFGDIMADTLEDGRWIEVDLANQMVRAYEYDQVIKEFLTSTGTAAHPTVKGNYHIYVKYRYADMRGPGYYLPNVPYTMYFYQSYGLHGTYWHNNFGTTMSHGCVNLQTDNAAWLYQWASVGTLVHVH